MSHELTLATVLGEIPDRPAAMADLLYALGPGGILAFASRPFLGNRFAYIIYFEKPNQQT